MSSSAGRAATAASEAPLGRAAALLEAHEIFVRVYTGATRPWFPFHKDRSELTINIALSNDNHHEGGRLIALYGGKVRAIERREGEATIHPSSLMHAVSRMISGRRYALIIFVRCSPFALRCRSTLRASHPNALESRVYLSRAVWSECRHCSL